MIQRYFFALHRLKKAKEHTWRYLKYCDHVIERAVVYFIISQIGNIL